MVAVIKNRKTFFSISAVLVVVSLIAVSVWGLKLGIDFTGGTISEMHFEGDLPEKGAVEQVLSVLDIEGSTVAPFGENGYLVRMPFIEESTHNDLIGAFQESYGDAWREDRFETVGPSISDELREKTFSAIAIVVLAIVLYIAWAFRSVSAPVKSWKYGIVAIVALIHDVVIPTGIFAVLGHFYGVEVDVLFVTALLTILGFSVNDTIVTFDRVRENLLKRKHDDFEHIVNDSVNQTISRSINTSVTTLLALLAIYFFGGTTTKNFVLTLSLGVVIGTYSSLFLASPLLVEWYKRSR